MQSFTFTWGRGPGQSTQKGDISHFPMLFFVLCIILLGRTDAWVHATSISKVKSFRVSSPLFQKRGSALSRFMMSEDEKTLFETVVPIALYIIPVGLTVCLLSSINSLNTAVNGLKTDVGKITVMVSNQEKNLSDLNVRFNTAGLSVAIVVGVFSVLANAAKTIEFFGGK